jgi:hypothetical protein
MELEVDVREVREEPWEIQEFGFDLERSLKTTKN